MILASSSLAILSAPPLAHGRSRNSVGMWVLPPAIRKAATGIFLWPGWGLYRTITGNKFKHVNFSHD
jgi:hypothetical protein